MKTGGAVFKKLKEIKFRHWLVLYKKLSKKTPINCKYNYKYDFIGNDGKIHELRLCMIHQESTDLKTGIFPHLLDVCQADIDCINCNGFIQRYTREEIKRVFDEELSVKKIKETKYPDICALDWVLERSSVYQSVNWVRALYYRIKNLILGI